MNNRSTYTNVPQGTGGFFLGLVTGLLVGGVAVMLYAPKSGPDTRSMLRDEYNKTQQMLQNWANDIRDRANEFSQIIRFRTEQESTVAGNGQKTHPL